MTMNGTEIHPVGKEEKNQTIPNVRTYGKNLERGSGDDDPPQYKADLGIRTRCFFERGSQAFRNRGESRLKNRCARLLRDWRRARGARNESARAMQSR
jgi:hypothetical protein